MKAINIPTKFPIPFAGSAVAPNIRPIPQASQIGIQAGAASLTDGFPPVTFLPVGAGGVPPFGADMNGIINQATGWDRWFSAGGPVAWDSAFSALIGGYPLGAVVRALVPASSWISTVDDNLTNPDTGGAGWSPYGPSSGDAKLTWKATADYGWLLLTSDGTIGNAASNATIYANALAASLFTTIYNAISNTWAPLLTSAGAPVARGANAAADFAANRQLTLPLQLGRALAIAGAGAGLTNHVLGQSLGTETVVISQANLPAVTLATTIVDPTHVHSVKRSGNAYQSGADAAAMNGVGGGTQQNTEAAATGITASTALGGSGTPTSIYQPTSFWNVMIKL